MTDQRDGVMLVAKQRSRVGIAPRRFAIGLTIFAIFALSGCDTGTRAQTSPTSSDALNGTGLSACPLLSDVSVVSDSSQAELRDAVSKGNGGIEFDAVAKGLTAAVLPDANTLETAVVQPAAANDHASIYAAACGQAVVDDSLTITACDAQCQANSSEAAKITTWWLDRGGHWYLWNAT